MADDVLQSLWVAIGWKADEASKAVATKSVQDYQAAVERAEKAIEDARWAGAKTEEEIARLTRELNLKLAKEALEKAKKEERDREEADKKQAAALKAARARIGDFVKVAIGMGAAIEAAALGVHAGVVKMAQGFDTLNFTSQRTGVTVRNIQAIGYAASQMGSTVEAGVGSLENFARTLRQSPGSYSLLERLGIKTTDATGARRSADALFQEFGKALRSKPGYLQDAYLQDFGIDEKTGRALIQGLDKYTEAYNEKLRKTGLDPDKAAKDGAALQRTFGSLGASLEIIGQKVSSRLFEGENNGFQRFVDWLDAHGNEIAEVIAHIAQVVVELAKALLELVTSPEAKKWFDQLMLAFGDFDKESGKFVANTDKMKVALGIFGAFVATSWVKKILDAFGGVGTGWKALLTLFGIATPVGVGLATAGAGALAGAATAEEMPKVLKEQGAGAIDPATGGAMEENGFSGLGPLLRRGYRAVKRALGGGGAEAHSGNGALPPRGDGTGTPRAARTGEMMRYAMDQLRREGVPEGQIREAAAHLVGQATMESGLNPNTVHDNGTGYGIYGARDPGGRGRQRRTEMLQWLKANGYAPNSAEGQMREMVHRAMSGQYPRTRDVLMGRGTGDIGTDTTTITKEFEAPARINDRSGAVRDALRTGPSPDPAKVEVKVAPTPAPQASSERAPAAVAQAPQAKPVTVKELFPSGLPIIAPSSLPSFASPAAPAVSSADYSRTTSITVNQGDLNVTGHQEARQIGEVYKAAQGYRNSDLIRNIRSSLA